MEKLLQTRIQLKYDTLSNWEASSVILKTGEAAVATYSYIKNEVEVKAVKVKYGDGVNTFNNLPEVTAINDTLADAIASLRSEFETYKTEISQAIAADKEAQAAVDAAQNKALNDYKAEMTESIAADKAAQKLIDEFENRFSEELLKFFESLQCLELQYIL